MKFKILFEEMLKFRADYVATGHYARLRREFPISKFKKETTRLFEAMDKNKDQSYFLYRLKQKYLNKIIFPLGEYEKTQVRKMAKKMKLPVWEKSESQDICFLENTTPSDFLKKYLKLKKGAIIDISGKIIGNHLGLPLYTLGQRKGINLGGTGPYYVISKDLKKNRLIVANRSQNLPLFSKETKLEKVNWILERPALPAKILVRTRYRNPLVYATIVHETYGIEHGTKIKKGLYKIRFSEPQRAVTPGQSAVFYSEKGEILGGGIIKS